MRHGQSWKMSVMAMALLVALGACGRKTGPVVDPGEEPEAPAVPSTPAPTPAPSAGPVVPQPSPVNPVPTADLTSRLLPVQTRGMLMSRTVVAEVEVLNPNDVRVMGALTVKFGDGTGTDGTQTRNLSLEPREVKTVTFERKAWFGGTAVQASIVTQKPQLAAPGIMFR